jgi:hypothetical protein
VVGFEVSQAAPSVEFCSRGKTKPLRSLMQIIVNYNYSKEISKHWVFADWMIAGYGTRKIP